MRTIACVSAPTHSPMKLLNSLASRKDSGFALTVALLLMAFAVLLILSLTTFVVQEQKAASIATNQLEASQNAMFGLQVALGRLQVAMGPDTRN